MSNTNLIHNYASPNRAGRNIIIRLTQISIVCVALTFAGYPVTSLAAETVPSKSVTSVIIRYEVGAPPATSKNRPWGTQCVRQNDRELIDRRGRWVGAGMRKVILTRAVSQLRAERIARDISLCPYIEFAEPNLPIFGAHLAP